MGRNGSDLKLVMLTLMVVAMAVIMAGHTAIALTLCKMDQDGLDSCKPSVTNPNPTDPSPDCCKALSEADLSCLCSYKKSPLLPALGIDPDLAMGLPAKCGLTPPADCSPTV